MSFKCFFQNLYYFFFLGIWFAWWNAVRKKIKNPRESREAKKVKPKSPSRVPTSPLMAGGDGCGERDGKRGGYKWGGGCENNVQYGKEDTSGGGGTMWKGGHKWGGGGDNVERRTQVGGGASHYPNMYWLEWKRQRKITGLLEHRFLFWEKKLRSSKARKPPKFLGKNLKEHSSPDHRTHLVSISDGGGSFVLF